MVWQEGITHIFTQTNIVIPKHKHVKEVFFLLGGIQPLLSVTRKWLTVYAKITCQGYPWTLHQRSPQVFLSLFVGRLEGTVDGRKERKKKERMERCSQEEGICCASLGHQPQARALRMERGVCLPGGCNAKHLATKSRRQRRKRSKQVSTAVSEGFSWSILVALSLILF